MLNPREMAEFFGFTEKEVQELCSKYDRSFEETKAWYNGYELSVVEAQKLKVYAMYNPKSVVDAMLSGIFDNYWNQTETYEALKEYHGNLLLAGINYDRKTKKHSCVIEKYEMI